MAANRIILIGYMASGKTTLGESIVDTIAFGNSFRNDKSMLI